MNITITDRANQALEELNTVENSLLKLKYETEGCGCVVSGVNELWVVTAPDVDDIFIETNGTPILVERSKRVFLDEALTVDYSDVTQMFMLKSPNQILNPRMRLLNKVNVR
ncbi:iron-sulfur cluster biosynthesis family protein [Pullulanibacillus camelliae]|nr:iron-sulfur cluster biosynthesis family protein [Pullulanibacillus camelliae]